MKSIVNLLWASVILACAAFLALAASAEDKVLFESLQVGRNTVRNVRVVDATPTHVTIFYDGGGSRLKRQELPPELKALYPYDAKEAADYEKLQAANQEQRAAAERARQEQFNRELKASLQVQRPVVQQRLEQLQKELNQLEKEIAPMKGKARGRPHSAARAELNAALDKKQALVGRIGEQKRLLETIDKQLDHLP